MEKQKIQSVNLVNKADETMKKLANTITTSKIRGLMAQVNELYNDILLEKEEVLAPQYVDKIVHLRVKMVYDAGRVRQEEGNKTRFPNKGSLLNFFEETGLLEMVKNIGNSRSKFLEYCRYFEALVAYHKFYGGKE